MKSLALEKKVFTTKQAAVIVFIIVAMISFFGSISFNDFCIKVAVYGGLSVIAVFFAAKFLSSCPEEGNKEGNKNHK